jgi:murein DD-endopeptidase MepM/ murein hydrolase activator NlpD
MKCKYPFDTKKYEVKIAKFKGYFAHENFPESRYAVDFILPLGTPVSAVKRGIVIFTKHDSEIHHTPKELTGLEESEILKLAEKTLNYIGIRHGNGTFTEYCHLSRREAVKIGQAVETGNAIGYTGESGIMDLPHLHFNAFKIENGKGISIPVEFVR